MKINRSFVDCAGSIRRPARNVFAVFVFVLLFAGSAFAQLANVWHIPSATQTGIPSTMRDPLSPGAGQDVTFYQGVYKGDGANQTGGTFYYRIGGGAWQSLALSWSADSNSNQFWAATATLPATPTSLFEYYFAPTFSNRTSPTYIYGSNQSTADPLTAQAAPTSFTVGAAPLAMTVSTASTGSLNADYTTTKLYIDEVAGDSVPVTVTFSTGALDTTEAEVWTDLNNRDRAAGDANGDGIDDGILPPDPPNEKPSGYTSGPYPVNGYFQAIPMAGSSGTYSITLNANKTGAYRLTARYRT